MMPWASMIPWTLTQWIRIDLIEELLTLAYGEQFAWLFSLAFQSLQIESKANKQREERNYKFLNEMEMKFEMFHVLFGNLWSKGEDELNTYTLWRARK